MVGENLRDEDRKMDETISGILRLGVSIAAVLAIVGMALYLKSSGGLPPMYKTFHAARFPKGWLEAAILMLILTPVARVLFSIFAFAQQKDTTYVVITLIVLGLLGVGWFTGYAA
jgi:uncharacterized membrane protein